MHTDIDAFCMCPPCRARRAERTAAAVEELRLAGEAREWREAREEQSFEVVGWVRRPSGYVDMLLRMDDPRGGATLSVPPDHPLLEHAQLRRRVLISLEEV